jgi:hypothetical protein
VPVKGQRPNCAWCAPIAIAIELGALACGAEETGGGAPAIGHLEPDRDADLDVAAGRTLAALRERHPGLSRRAFADRPTRTLSLVLPDEATGAVEIADPSSDVNVSVSLLDATPAPAGHADRARV